MKASIATTLARLPGPPSARYLQGAPFAAVMAHGTMSVEVFAPQGVDLQTPHSQDELYFVQAGTGQIVISGQRFDAAAGDAFFVAAQVEHRFENFSNDFVTWVVFYGPPGGE
ncbi:MAG: cupin [Polaromonas sp. 39-63-203]|jgi:mannose-6-phosphate isomerase-like protein (cupin superfamily)|uniref:cupin domain-containing protein n=1 Tax=Polaromonas sp. TaxID=1869339 RepID=UPI000BD03234|nr:cupin domain-containing protein [Polaromonas sp.]OYY53943.1 MAG: cupin [Polaromonas sp. 35-63-240]OYZ03391.1 MAG: cupin [Polaromonas sp. 28-63-22]OYZ84977.1 MAG: cupin [Polaromonas sp. 24-62-144]OZB00171.1 MAG: cupin [Polaromonas sp. 39-63-203]HQS31629.1 cupin domain-containing protein [Polaromonas sp.]